MVANRWSKFRLLMWKNSMLQWRKPKQTFFVFAVPVFFTAILLLYSQIGERVVVDTTTIYPPIAIGNLVALRFAMGNNVDFRLAYSPKSPHLETFLSEVANAIHLDGIIGYATAADMEEQLIRRSLFVGVQFSTNDTYDTSLPQHLSYSLRFPAILRTTLNLASLNWQTDRTLPSGPISRLPRNRNDADGGRPPGYHREGFLTVQNAIADQFLRLHSANAQQLPESVRLQRYPHPPYRDNGILPELSTVYIMFIMLAFLYPMTVLVETIATERERKLTESMKIMGLPGWMHWLGRFVQAIVQMAIIVSLVVLVLKLGSIFVLTDWTVLWLYLFVYAVSMTCFGLMMSTMFESAKVAVFVAEMVYIVMFLVFVVLPVEQMERYQLLLVTLLINPGMGVGLTVLLQLEQLQVGAQWSQLFAAQSGTSVDINLGGTMMMMLAAAVVYVLIGLYVEQVKPGSSGVSRPWWFLCSRDFWNREKSASEPAKPSIGVDGANNSLNAEHFEATNSGAYAGIRMRGLRKIYGHTEALRPFDLDMYEDQITVLLGHNGAGKTTTMSILTGMIEPSEGTALVNGFDIRTQMPSVRGSIGLCPQHNILFDEMTVAEHIRFYCGLKGCDATETQHEVQKYVDLMQLQGKSDTRSAALSGGQKRMLSVCIAFCGGSKVIFCDEPSSGMDPAARRNLWRIFELEKAGRTVLLSTHFMDEADVLGDRIAIMNSGDLKSVGTPFFLKKHFGLGYHLNCAVTKQTQRSALTEFLRQHIASIALEKDTGTELSYNLPDEHSDRFADMFRGLEEAKETLDVRSYGVSLGTLEEVFLKVGSDANDEHNYDIQPGSSTTTVHHIPFQTNMALICSQFHAMFAKKWLQFARNLPLSLGQIILPSVFVLLNAVIMISYMSSTGNLPELAINLAMVTNPVVMLQTDSNPDEQSLPHRFVAAYEQLSTENGATTHRVPYLRDAIIDQWRLNYNEVVLTNHIGARMIGTNEVEAWFNNQPFHAAPLSLGHMHNALLRVHLGEGFSISVRNAPLPFTAETRENPFTQLGQMWAFMLAYSMSFVMAMFAFAVVRERSNGADRLQFVSGVKVFVYWAAHFLSDYAMFVVSVALLFACMVGFGEPGYSTATDFGHILLVMLLFGFAALHLTYLLARFFTVQAQAFTALAMGYAISGLVLTAVSMAMRLTNQTKVVDIVTYVGMVVSPHFALATALQNLNRGSQSQGMCLQLCDSMLGNQCDAEWLCGLFAECCDRDVFEFSAHGLGAPLVYLAAVGAVCAAVNLMIDYDWFAWMAGCGHGKGKSNNSPDAASNTDLDGDVSLENQRINAMLGSDAIRSHALVVSNLTKNYGKLLAVNRLSLAVDEYECFGLLGVNGAGKTSTFGMLTGALPLRDGQAWIVGHNLRTDRQRANHVIGYTPQFDALIAEQTVRETLQMYCRLRGVPAEHIAEVIGRLAGELNFGQHLEKRVNECSGGNRRKLSTAVAMIGRPVVIFLDEPTTGMDPSARRSLWQAVDRTRKAGAAVVLTSHSMDECEVLCTRLAIMVNGQFECLGSVQHLKSKFSGGCTLVVKLRRPCADEATEVQRITAFVAEAFEGAVLQKHFLGLLTYAIPGHGEVQWSSMFGRMKQAQSVYAIESFTLSQSTLEEVFLKLAEKQVHK